LILELENPDVSVDRQSAALLELKNLSQDWTNRQDALQYGSLQLQIQAKNTPTIVQLFEQIEPDFRAINVLVDQFLSDASKLPSAKYLLVEKRQELLSRSESFLFGMESIVSHYEVESRQRVERLRSTEAWLVIATLVVLLCEGCFIFSPAVRSLRNSFRRIRAVTEQLQLAKMRAESASLAKTQLLTRVSHELRTPLHAILGMLTLVRKTDLTKSQRRQIFLASGAARSLNHLVDDLLDISSIEQGNQLKISLKPMRLATVVKDCIDVMQPIASKKALTIGGHIDRELPEWIVQDQHRLRQVLMNLLQNAVRYTDEGEILVNLQPFDSPKGPRLKIEVIDTGRGIPEKNFGRIFDSFTRLDEGNSVNSFGRGFGLGLPITQGIIEKMGGTVVVKSAMAVGTTFTVSVPLTPCLTPDVFKLRTKSMKVERPASTQTTVLIIDDAKTNRLLLRKYVRRLGLHAIEADSVNNGLRQWESRLPSVVLLDRHLSDEDGFFFAKKVRCLIEEKGGLSMPSIFVVTADTPAQCKQDLAGAEMQNDIVQVLYKPLSFRALRSALVDAKIVKLAGGLFGPSKPVDPEFSELQKKLKQIFFASFLQDFTTMQSCLRDRNYSELEKLAHLIHGAAGNAGIDNCSKMAREIELACQSNDYPIVSRSMTDLKNWVDAKGYTN